VTDLAARSGAGETSVLPAGDVLRDYWHPVVRLSDLHDRPVPFTLLGEKIALYRVGDRPVALQDLCIHRGSPLSLGWLEGETLVCGYHGWAYGPDGACVRIPSLPPGRSIPRKARAVAYRAEVRYGLVWVCLGEPRQPIPTYDAWDDERMAKVLYEPFRWQANAARVVENVLDFTHLPWVHNGYLGSREQPVYPEVSPVVTDAGLTYQLDDPTNDTTRHYRLSVPFTVELTVTPHTSEGHTYSMLFSCAPISSRETVQWFFTARNWSLDKPDLEWAEFDAVVMRQDQAIVETQRPEELPLDLTEELHLRGTDAGALEYRRLLKRLGVRWRL
jgi:phenylpropionate dioxygenase-like ring-hydroxylating dioxygenase large terminal subunit